MKWKKEGQDIRREKRKKKEIREDRFRKEDTTKKGEK